MLVEGRRCAPAFLTNIQHPKSNIRFIHPCRCLCFGFTQMTRTTPSRWITLHLGHMGFTDARTFITSPGALRLPSTNIQHPKSNILLSQLPRDSPSRQIVRREHYFHPVARQQPDKILDLLRTRMR
jgi:hypothetical protein